MRMHETQHNAKWVQFNPDLKWTQYSHELNGDRHIFSWQLFDYYYDWLLIPFLVPLSDSADNTRGKV